MKSCPICTTACFDGADVCTACGHRFRPARGAALTPAQAEWFRDRIAEMRDVFADETRTDWYDADDIARDIAEELARILGM